MQENLHESFVDLYKTDDEVRKSVDIIQEKVSSVTTNSDSHKSDLVFMLWI